MNPIDDKELHERLQKGNETPEDVTAIVDAYYKVFGRPVTRSCRNCYHDALFELIAERKKNEKQFIEKMEKTPKYVLRRGIAINMGFGTGQIYTRLCKDDKLAIQILAGDKKRAKDFDTIPDNWQEDVKAYKKAKRAEEPKEEKPADKAE